MSSPLNETSPVTQTSPVVETSKNGQPAIPVKMCTERDDPKKKKIKKVVNKPVDDKKKKGPTHMRAAFLKSKVWPASSVINVAFMQNTGNDPQDIARTDTAVMKRSTDRDGNILQVDPIQDEIDKISDVKEAIVYTITTRLQPMINIKFNFHEADGTTLLQDSKKADIRIDFDSNGGAWSLLGTDCLTADKETATMNFGWLDAPTTLHEFCHSLGMVHEHSNPNGVPINWAVCSVMEWAARTQGWDADTVQSNIIEKYKVDQINGSEFDPKSIMLYFFPGQLVCQGNSPDLGIDPTDSTQTKGLLEKCKKDSLKDDCSIPGAGTNQNLMFSPWDVLYLNNIYKPKEQTIDAPTFTVNLFQTVYGITLTPESLQNQLDMTAAREKNPPKSTATDKTAAGDVNLDKSKKKHEPFQYALRPESEYFSHKRGFQYNLNSNLSNGNFINLFIVVSLILWAASNQVSDKSFIYRLKHNTNNLLISAFFLTFVMFYFAEASDDFNELLYNLLSGLRNISPISLVLADDKPKCKKRVKRMC